MGRRRGVCVCVCSCVCAVWPRATSAVLPDSKREVEEEECGATGVGSERNASVHDKYLTPWHRARRRARSLARAVVLDHRRHCPPRRRCPCRRRLARRAARRTAAASRPSSKLGQSTFSFRLFHFYPSLVYHFKLLYMCLNYRRPALSCHHPAPMACFAIHAWLLNLRTTFGNDCCSLLAG